MMNQQSMWKSIGGGLLLLAVAGAWLANQLGWLDLDFEWWKWLAAAVLIVSAVSALAVWSGVGVMVSLGLLAWLYAEPLGLQQINGWTLVGIATVAGLGLDCLLTPLRRRRTERQWETHGETTWAASSASTAETDAVNVEDAPIAKTAAPEGFSAEAGATEDQNVTVRVIFGNVVRYVQSRDFQQAAITVLMGEAHVYFDTAAISQPGATISVNGAMGEIHLYVPRNWRVQSVVNVFLGELSQHGSAEATVDGPQVRLVGHFAMGEIVVHHI